MKKKNSMKEAGKEAVRPKRLAEKLVPLKVVLTSAVRIAAAEG